MHMIRPLKSEKPALCLCRDVKISEANPHADTLQTRVIMPLTATRLSVHFGITSQKSAHDEIKRAPYEVVILSAVKHK